MLEKNLANERNPSDAPFNSNTSGFAFQDCKNLKVETEVEGEVHFGTGPQRGIKQKMEEAEAQEHLAKSL